MVDQRGVCAALLGRATIVCGGGRKRGRLAVLAVLVSALILEFVTIRPATAVAQTSQDEAREHYRRGTAAYNLGKYTEAAHEYELAYEATLDAALLFNVGQAYRLAGDRKKALTAYRSYVRSAPDGDRRELAEARIREIETSLNYEDPFVMDDRASVPGAPAKIPPPPVAPPTVLVVPHSVSQVADSDSPRNLRPTVSVAPIPPAAVDLEPLPKQRRSRDADADAERRPIYKQWWFWAMGAGLAVAIVVVVVAVGSASGPPQTDLGTMRF